MKRLFALIGSVYLITLTAVIFMPADKVIFAIIVSGAMAIIFLIIKPLRKEKAVIVASITTLIASSVFLINYNLRISPVQELADKDLTVKGIICDLPQKKCGRYYYIINVSNIDEAEGINNFKIRLSSSNAIEADIYDTVTAKVHTILPKDTHRFSYKTYYMSKQIYLIGYFYEYDGISVEHTDNSKNPNYYALKARETILSAMRVLLPERQAAVAGGILLGEKNNIPQDIKNDFTNVGVYHLLTVSGVHVWIISNFIIMVLKGTNISNRLASAITCTFIFGFMAITAFTPSIVRAGIMAIVCLIGTFIYRKSDSINSLGFAVLIISIFNPNSGASIGLWMSSLAAVGIVSFSPEVSKFIKTILKIESDCGRISEYIIGTVSSSIAITLVTFPVAVINFRGISLISPLSNILMIFPISIMIICLLSAVCLYIFIPVAAFIYMPFTFISGVIINYFIGCASILSKIPFANTSIAFPFIKLWVAFTLVLVSIIVILKEEKRLLKFVLLLSSNILFAGILSYQISMRDITRVSVLNVGTGCSVVLSKNGHAAMISCGGEDIYCDEVIGALSDINVKKLDYVMIPSYEDGVSNFLDYVCGYYSPSVVVSPDRPGDKENLRSYNVATEKVLFSDKIKSRMWNNVKISSVKCNEKGFVKLRVSNIDMLLCPSGGDVKDIPIGWRSCDFLLLGGVPNGYKSINPMYTVLSMNSDDSKGSLSKLSSEGMSSVSVSDIGGIHIDIGASDELAIRRDI